MALVWSERGYPSSPAYRDYHRLTPHHHRVWRNDGAAYDPEAAGTQVVEHARDFIARASRRVERGGVCVCALDTCGALSQFKGQVFEGDGGLGHEVGDAFEGVFQFADVARPAIGLDGGQGFGMDREGAAHHAALALQEVLYQ